MGEDNIEIVVSFDTNSVETGIKSLQSSFRRISDATDGLASGIEQESNRISDAFSSMTVEAISDIDKLTQRAEYLSQSGEYLANLAAKADELATAFRRVAMDKQEYAILSGSADDSEKLIKEATAADTLANKYEKLAAGMHDKLRLNQEELGSVNEMIRKNQELDTTQSSLIDKLKQISAKLDHASAKFKQTSDNASKLSKVIKTFISYKVSKFLADATVKAIEFSESIHTFNVAAGESATELGNFVNTISRNFGLDKAEIISATAAFQQMGRNFGLLDDQASKVSRGFVQMAVDMQALYEVPLEDALSRLESVMTGYGRALRSNGILAMDTYLQEVALSLGIQEKVSTLNEASKVGLRYIAVMRQMSNAEGEFANTIESASNQMRVFKAQVSEFVRNVGSLFVGFVSKVLPYINGIIMALNELLKLLAKFFGFKLEGFESSTGGIADNVGAIGDAADSTAKKMKQLVAPFDELNILSEDTADSSIDLGSIGGIDPRILAAMEEYDSLFDKVRMKAHDVRDYIMHTLGFTERLNEETGELEWTWNFDDMLTGLQNAWNDVVTWWSDLDPGAQLVTVLLAGWLAYWAVTGLVSFLTPIIGLITSIISTIITYGELIIGAVSLPVLAIVALIGLIIAAVADLWTHNAEFRDKVTKMLDTLWAKLKKVVDSVKKAFIKLWEYFEKTFGPDIQLFVELLKNLWEDFKNFIGAIILNLLSFFDGLLTFLEGVFTADMDKALEGLYKMFLSVGTAIMNIFVLAMNAVVDAIEWGLNKAIDFVNKIIEALNKIPGVHFDYFEHVKLDAFKMQYDDVEDMLHGKYEGGSLKGYDSYNEDYRVYAPPSDYNEDYRVSSNPAAVSSNAGTQDIVDKIIVQIGGTQVDSEIYRSAQRGGAAVGLQTVGGGFTG